MNNLPSPTMEPIFADGSVRINPIAAKASGPFRGK